MYICRNICISCLFLCNIYSKNSQKGSVPQWNINIESSRVLYSLPSDPGVLVRSKSSHLLQTTLLSTHSEALTLCHLRRNRFVCFLNVAHRQNIHLWLFDLPQAFVSRHSRVRLTVFSHGGWMIPWEGLSAPVSWPVCSDWGGSGGEGGGRRRREGVSKETLATLTG